MSAAPHAVRAFVGLGANLGPAAVSVRAALQALGDLPHCRLGAVSSLYRSAPIDASGPDYVNAVAELWTHLPALRLLHGLQGIERSFGRRRGGHNAPRTLDLDLLLYGDAVMNDAELVLPHPRSHLRAFVLQPLAEIDAGLCLPGLGPIGSWLRNAAHQSIEKLSPI